MRTPDPVTDDATLRDLIGRGDLDGLVRRVDELAAREDWDRVLQLRARCEEAAERYGKQLWGAGQYAAYRVALEAPGEIAAPLVEPGAARFALGPLTEVVAARHRWAELADHLPHRVSAAMVAQERVLRGEDLRGDERAHPEEVELPLVLQDWEGSYPLPEYRRNELLEGGLEPVPAHEEISSAAGPARSAPRVEAALEELAGHWAAESTGELAVAVVDGDAAAAVAALLPTPARMARIEVPAAVTRMAWAAASGGNLGRRRGLAAGRSSAWWVAHQITGLAFPAAPDQLGAALRRCRWFVFDDDTPPSGWQLRLAVEVPVEGWAAALDASDSDPADIDSEEQTGG